MLRGIPGFHECFLHLRSCGMGGRGRGSTSRLRKGQPQLPALAASPPLSALRDLPGGDAFGRLPRGREGSLPRCAQGARSSRPPAAGSWDKRGSRGSDPRPPCRGASRGKAAELQAWSGQNQTSLCLKPLRERSLWVLLPACCLPQPLVSASQM